MRRLRVRARILGVDRSQQGDQHEDSKLTHSRSVFLQTARKLGGLNEDLPAVTDSGQQEAEGEAEQSSQEEQQEKPVVQQEVEGDVQVEELWEGEG